VFDVQLLAARRGAGFVDHFCDCFTGSVGALLNAANLFGLLAFNEWQIVIGEFSPLLLQRAFGDTPVAFAFKCRHNLVTLDIRLKFSIGYNPVQVSVRFLRSLGAEGFAAG
jgi:hypothetical protein